MRRYKDWKSRKAGWSCCHNRVKLFLYYFVYGHGNGDLLYNTARKIIEDNDTSEWAHASLENIFFYLNLGVRWSECMNQYITLGEERRHHMTQDPWILAYCCAAHLDRYDLIEKYKPSRKIFNLPDKWAWRRALLGKPNLYFIWRVITPTWFMQNFVYVFYGFMDQAYLTVKQKKNEKKNLSDHPITLSRSEC